MCMSISVCVGACELCSAATKIYQPIIRYSKQQTSIHSRMYGRARPSIWLICSPIDVYLLLSSSYLRILCSWTRPRPHSDTLHVYIETTKTNVSSFHFFSNAQHKTTPKRNRDDKADQLFFSHSFRISLNETEYLGDGHNNVGQLQMAAFWLPNKMSYFILLWGFCAPALAKCLYWNLKIRFAIMGILVARFPIPIPSTHSLGCKIVYQ